MKNEPYFNRLFSRFREFSMFSYTTLKVHYFQDYKISDI